MIDIAIEDNDVKGFRNNISFQDISDVEHNTNGQTPDVNLTTLNNLSRKILLQISYIYFFLKTKIDI